MTLKLKKFKTATAPIKNQADLDKIMATIESDAWYICFSGSVAMFDDAIVFKKNKAEYHYDNLVDAVSKSYKASKSLQDKEEAMEIMRTMMMIPMRIH